jgi:hypothetical protein
VIKAFINIKEGLYAPGLACVAEKVSSLERDHEVRLGINTTDGWTFSEN